MKIFVLHYSKLTERKIDIINHFKQQGIIDYEFIELFDKDNLTSDQLGLFDDLSSRSRISLTLKHIHVYERCFKENYDEVLVFEDDVILSKNFVEKLKKYKRELPSDYDMLFIGDGCNIHIHKDNIIPTQNIYKPSECKINMSVQGETKCTDSYLISKKACASILEYIKTKEKLDHTNADLFLNYAIKNCKLQVYWAEPTIVTQGSQNRKYESTCVTDSL